MKKIENLKTIIIKQSRVWSEILTGVEQRNRYAILDENGDELYFAGERDITFFRRLFMKSMRPFEIIIVDETETPQLIIRRPYRWWSHECSVFMPDETLLAHVKWEFAWFNRQYTITDIEGSEVFKLFGPVFKPWTFRIMKLGNNVGVLAKKWESPLKEFIRNEDTFAIMLDEALSLKEKQILLGAIFLIDFVHFEKR